MQQLTYHDKIHQYDDEIAQAEARQPKPQKMIPLKFEVRENYNLQCVELVIGDKTIVLTTTGATDLANALRLAAIHVRDGGERRRRRGK